MKGASYLITSMLNLGNIHRAREEIGFHLPKTPLIFSQYLSARTGAKVFLKLENLQPTRSFKVRGAINKLRKLDQLERRRPLVAASAGNHGLGVAYAAETLGFDDLTVFVPRNCPKPKLNKFSYFSMNLKLEGDSYDEAVIQAKNYLNENDGIWISAYDDLDIIAGQATIGLEILDDIPEVDRIFVPTGGGGLIAGIALVTSLINPTILVTGIQPEACPSALLSLRNGKALDPFEHEPTIADGLAGGFGKLPFRVAGDLIDDILLASEEEVQASVFALLVNEQLLAEPSGAISISPLLSEKIDVASKTVVCVISGGNLSLELLAEIIENEVIV